MHQPVSPLAPMSYSPKEVGIICGVKTGTVHAWISRKEIRAIKVGHLRFISSQAIRDMYLQRKTGEYVDHTYANGPVRR